MKKRIYMDYAAITPVAPEVMKEIVKYSSAEYGNPSAIHTEGVLAKKAVDTARKKIADLLQGHSNEIVFTGSGTEANNLAIVGRVEALIHNGAEYSDLHFITSAIEHPSVMRVAQWLRAKGVTLDIVGVDQNGIVDVKQIKEKIRPNTFMISVMLVNNEIGTIQPIDDIAKLVRAARKARGEHLQKKAGKLENEIVLHVDASQAPEYISLDMRSFGADLVTLDGQKMYGPRGIGMLWVKRGIQLSSIVHGGKQEQGLRSGTENVAAICGFAKALELASTRREKETLRVLALRDYFISRILTISGVTLNGSIDRRIANNINISVAEADTEFLLIQLDTHGIACSTKSSCLADEDESYVIRALGRGREAAVHSLRFSLGRDTTKADIDAVMKTLKKLGLPFRP